MADRDEPEMTDAGIAGGQGKTAQQVEDSTLCAAWAVVGFLVCLAALGLYRLGAAALA